MPLKDLKTLFNMIHQVKSILSKRQRIQLVLLLFVILFGAIWEMLGVSVMYSFIQALMFPEQLMANPYMAPLLSLFHITDTGVLLSFTCLIIISVYLLKNLILLLSSYLQIRYKTSLLQKLSVLMLKSYMNHPYSFFVNTNSGKILRGITNDTSSVHDIIEVSLKLISEAFVVILIGFFIFCTDAVMALGILIVGTFCLLLLLVLFKKKLSAMGHLNREAFAENNNLALQIVSGIKDIFVSQKREYFLGAYDNSYTKRRTATTSFQFSSACPERIIEAVCVTGILGITLLRLKSGVELEIFIPQLAVFAMAAFRILPSISRISGYINSLIFNRPALESAYDNIMDAKQYLIRNENKETFKETCQDISFEKEVCFNNICWHYKNQEKDVLHNLSLTITKGTSIGIIGESGAGKSTFSDIVLGLYQPQSGSVTVDGNDIFQIPIGWSRLINYVPQVVFLLDNTIRNNVAFGEDYVEDKAVWNALELANLKDFVKSLPDGLDTMVGERGIKFSGGQRQRIAIARALYRNPDILVLDEATSALDNDTETAVMDAINTLQGQKTLIIIAHRLSTIEKCDKIYKIEKGKCILQ